MVEAHHRHIPKIVSFHLAMGPRRWFVVGYYLTPDNATSIKRVVGTMAKRPRKADLLVVGYLNKKLADPEGNYKNDAITLALSYAGLKYMSVRFLPLRTPWARDGQS